MKNINDMSEEDVKKEINRLRNMTDEEREIEINKIRKEYEQFKEDAVPKILKILEEDQYRIDICCQGLIIILKALLQNFGTKQLLEECVSELQKGMNDLPGIVLDDLDLEG